MRLNSFKKLVLAATVGLAGLMPLSAFAGDRNDWRYDRGDRYDHRRDHKDNYRFDFGIRIGEPNGGYYPAPAPVTERVWVPPVYRTVCDRVWVAPVYRTECDRVWIEPVYEIRNVVRWEHGRRVVCRERVLVCAGRWENRERQVLVAEGHWQNVERQELVSAGHWEYRTVAVAQPAPVNSFSFGFGYRGR